MKKTIQILLFLLLFLLFSACKITVESNEDFKLKSNKLVGVWEFKNFSPIDAIKNVNFDNKVKFPEKLVIGKDWIYIDDSLYENINIRYRKVNYDNLMLIKYKTIINKRDDIAKDVSVYTFYDNDKFISDIVSLNSDEILYKKGNFIFYFQRKKDKVDDDTLKELKKTDSDYNGNGKNKISSGFIFTVKQTEVSDFPKFDYKTYYVTINQNKVNVYRWDGILLPRKKGFEVITVKQTVRDEAYVDKIVCEPLERYESNEFEHRHKLVSGDKYLIKEILYAGNDIISYKNHSNYSENSMDSGIYLINRLDEEKPIDYTDLINREKAEVNLKNVSMFNVGSENYTPKEDFSDKKDMFQSSNNKEEEKYNLKLVRKNGYWFIESNKIGANGDFEDSKFFPAPDDIVKYDRLSVNWDYASERFKGMEDIFTSPDDEYAVLKFKDNIKIYGIKNQNILKPLICEFSVQEGSIIMNEWATDSYVDMWRDVILSMKADKLAIK